MATQINFRSAFNGFNREDVVRYIEYLNNKHSGEISQLNTELDYLRNRQPELPAPQSTALPEDDTVAQQAARIRELFDRCNALEEELKAVQTEKAQLAQQLEGSYRQQNSVQCRMEEELEAYRRAERTERYARERAESLYRQANGALADATVKVDDAATQVGQMTDLVIAQLTELQNAVLSSKQALRDAAATMYTIRPTTDKP